MGDKYTVTIRGHEYEFDLQEIEQAKQDMRDGKGVPLDEALRRIREPLSRNLAGSESDG
jgi:hypothetical protein